MSDDTWGLIGIVLISAVVSWVVVFAIRLLSYVYDHLFGEEAKKRRKL